jgi:ribose 5-phosphate isomerase A
MNLKQQAALKALEFVQSGMYLGLGSGSTSAFFVDLLGDKIQSGILKDIVAVPTSKSTAAQASAVGIKLSTLAEIARVRHNKALLDLAVDGADEVDLQLNLIKGLGRALLREKIIEIHSRKFIVIVDESKIVARLGSKCPLPVEILPFEAEAHINWLNSLGCRAEMWYEEDGSPIVTDNGNNLALCWFADGIIDPHSLARLLADRPGIIEHGLFLNMASSVIVAGEEGVRILDHGMSVMAGGVE